MRLWLAAALTISLLDAAETGRVTILYDSHAIASLAHGWGYAAWVEYRGRRILFDAGPNAAALEKNSKALGLDISKADVVVISHDDPDHYGGLPYVLAVNPGVKVYVPESDYGAFSKSLLNRLFRFVEGAMPGRHLVDPPAGLNYVAVNKFTDILPGVRVVPLSFDSRREQFMALEVPGGIAVLTGCAHPGIVRIVKDSGAPVRLAAGGFHLTNDSESDVRRVVAELKQAGVESVWPGHCTGRFATEELRRKFRKHFGVAAVGGRIALPGD
jgi:7,8-dihydropterin-6-yl-methyl-4-(beta-D-ribofuranosyl)aminobenzene 5'-phosphate synthase